MRFLVCVMSWSDSEREVLTSVESDAADQWAGEDDEWLAGEVDARDDAEAAVRAFRGLLLGVSLALGAWTLIAFAVLGVYGLLA